MIQVTHPLKINCGIRLSNYKREPDTTNKQLQTKEQAL